MLGLLAAGLRFLRSRAVIVGTGRRSRRPVASPPIAGGPRRRTQHGNTMDKPLDPEPARSAEPAGESDFEFRELDARLAPGLLALCYSCSQPSCDSCAPPGCASGDILDQ